MGIQISKEWLGIGKLPNVTVNGKDHITVCSYTMPAYAVALIRLVLCSCCYRQDGNFKININ